MISKQKIDWIRGLAQKKERDKAGCFVAEGAKLVADLLKSALHPVEVYCTEEGRKDLPKAIFNVTPQSINRKEMGRISAFKTPSEVLALFRIPEVKKMDWNHFKDFALVLDGIQDPGNLGTIVRTADWFGISNIFCSFDCSDVFNHKCVQATMGAIARVAVHYLDLLELLQTAQNHNIQVFGTFMEGENLYEANLGDKGFIVMGSEGRGISSDLLPLLTGKIAIPPFPAGNQELESLNVAISAAIITSELRRRAAY